MDDPSLLTIHNCYGYVHPGTRLLEAPIRLEPCVLRWKTRGGATDYLLTSLADLHQMALWVLDLMAVNLHVPHTLSYYDIPPEAALGRYSPLEGQDVIDEVEYERFQGIRRAQHGPLAWWWLQRNMFLAEDGVWKFEFIPVWEAKNPSPVPTDPPPSPITWLTPP
jgi:hypothetical protein